MLTSEILILPNAFEFTMLGLAAGGGAFSFKNGSTWFGLPHMGYPLIFPYNTHGKWWEESEVRMRKSSTKQMLNSEMGPSLLFLCSYFIPGHSEKQGLPFLHESTAESTRQVVTIFVLHSSNRLTHLYSITLDAEAMWGTTMAFFISARPGFM